MKNSVLLGLIALVLLFATNPSLEDVYKKIDDKFREAISYAPPNEDTSGTITRLGCKLSDDYCLIVLRFIFKLTDSNDWGLFSYYAFQGPANLSFHCYGFLAQVKCNGVSFDEITKAIVTASAEQIENAQQLAQDFNPVSEGGVLRQLYDDVERFTREWLPDFS